MGWRALVKHPYFHVGLTILFLVGTVAGAWSWTPWNELNQWLANTAPEFFGAAVITLLIGAYLRDDARRSYIKAMRSVRS